MTAVIGPLSTGLSTVPVPIGDGRPVVVAIGVLLLLAAGTVAVAAHLASRRQGAGDRWIAVSLGLSTTAAWLWTVSALVGVEPTSRVAGLPAAGIPLIAHGLFLVAFPVLLVGLVRQAEVDVPVLRLVRGATDVLTAAVVGAAVVVAWRVGRGLGLGDGPAVDGLGVGADLALSTAYPLGDLVRLVLVAAVWSRLPSGSRARWSGWLLTLLCWTVADLQALAAVASDIPRAPLGAVLGYGIGYLAVLVTLLREFRSEPRPEDPRDARPEHRDPSPSGAARSTDAAAGPTDAAARSHDRWAGPWARRANRLGWPAAGLLLGVLAVHEVTGRVPPAALVLAVTPVLLLAALRLVLQAELQDRRDRERAVRELASRWTELRARSLLERAVDPYLEFDADGSILAASERFETLLGWSSHELAGRDAASLVVDPDRRTALRTPDAGAEGGDVAVVLRHRDGSDVPVAVSPWSTEIEGARRHHVFVRDLRPQRKREADLLHRARHDVLTGLPNRYALDADIDGLLGLSRVALLLLDLDGFKAINDQHGHAVGDAVLVALAERLRRSSREEDLLVRLGGDEFALVVTHADAELATQIAWRSVGAVREPVAVDGRSLELGVSIGVALSPDHGRELLPLLRAADDAMYRAKHGGLGVMLAGESAVVPHTAVARPTGAAVGTEAPSTPTVRTGER